MFLSGCAASWKETSSKPFSGPSRSYIVQLPDQWKRAPTSDSDQLILTRNGLFLQQISILKLPFKRAFPNIDAGKTINQEDWNDILPEELGQYQYQQLKSGYAIRFDVRKEEFEGILSAFTVDSAKPSDPTTQLVRLDPDLIDKKPVFELETTSYNNWGLEYKTLSYGFVHNKNYWLLQYKAPTLYFYDKYLPDFVNFKNSLRLKESCFIFCSD